MSSGILANVCLALALIPVALLVGLNGRLVWRRRVLHETRVPLPVPAVAGLLGLCIMFAARPWIPGITRWAWVPLAVDFTVPMMLLALRSVVARDTRDDRWNRKRP